MTALSLMPGVTIGEARRLLADSFRQAGMESPELDARSLIGHGLSLDRARVVAEDKFKLSEHDVLGLEQLAARRLSREPVARILGVKEFWGLPLGLNDHTLVPRPETETVVEAALAAVDQRGSRARPLRILDLGTGTGALLLALLTELPNATGLGSDISTTALEMAGLNAANLDLAARAEFIDCDFGSLPPGRFDLVVSNPPYIPSAEIAALSAEVRRDPTVALDGGPDGLDCYRAIARQVRQLLKATGDLVVELGMGQEATVATLFRAAGLSVGPARADLAGIPRALPARVATITP